MGEQVLVRIREIPSIVQQFRSLLESSQGTELGYCQTMTTLENLTVSFQKEGLFNVQIPCQLEGNDSIRFSVPKREVFLPYLQQLSNGHITTLHHCCVTISARNTIPNQGDCLMVLMYQSCCSVVCLEAEDMMSFMSECFDGSSNRLRGLLRNIRERFADDFGAMLHAEDEYPLTKPFRNALRIVKEIGKGSNGFVHLVEKKKLDKGEYMSQESTDKLKGDKKLALKQSFFSYQPRVIEYVRIVS